MPSMLLMLIVSWSFESYFEENMPIERISIDLKIIDFKLLLYI